MTEREEYEQYLTDVGWICPRCDIALSPDLEFCPYCSAHASEIINPIRMIFLN
jgi:rubrerythrin